MSTGDSLITHPTGAELQLDTAPADWIRDRLYAWGGADVGNRVCAFVPTGYEVYARVFHHAAPRRVGSLDRREATALVSMLRAFTSSPNECWLAIWHGFGQLQGPPAIRALRRPGILGWLQRRRLHDVRLEAPTDLAGAPTVSLPFREYFLYRGSIDVVPRFEHLPGYLQTPNMWWPDDRAWFVATEIDFDSTLIGCTRECATALLAGELEVMEVSAETRLDVDGDTVNIK